MTLPTNFHTAVLHLYFEVDIRNSHAFQVVRELGDVANWHHVHPGIAGEHKVLHVFQFVKSPLNGLVVDTGYIEVVVHEEDGVATITGLDWYFRFFSRADAERFFTALKDRFLPLSSQHQTGIENDGNGAFASFSSALDGSAIQCVRFVLSRSLEAGQYEIRLMPF